MLACMCVKIRICRYHRHITCTYVYSTLFFDYSDVMVTSSAAAPVKPDEPVSRDVQFGDVEMFLMSEQLSRLIPLFREHHVCFSDLLVMTDKELEQV